MKKAELRAHNEMYQRLLSEAKAAVLGRSFQRGIERAASAWNHVDEMMQFQRKYQKHEFVPLECVDIVLRYAPLLLEIDYLNRLEELLKTKRRVERNSTENLKMRLGQARGLFHYVYQLFDCIESGQSCRIESLPQTIHSKYTDRETVIAQLVEIGLARLQRSASGALISLITSMESMVSGKCMHCGHVEQSQKSDFLLTRVCSCCGQHTLFVILAETTAA